MLFPHEKRAGAAGGGDVRRVGKCIATVYRL